LDDNAREANVSLMMFNGACQECPVSGTLAPEPVDCLKHCLSAAKVFTVRGHGTRFRPTCLEEFPALRGIVLIPGGDVGKDGLFNTLHYENNPRIS
jgi:hypothetical protein